MRARYALREKQMTNESAKKLADEALEKLAAALEQGHSETLRTYLAVMGKFHQYSWGNALLIASQRQRNACSRLSHLAEAWPSRKEG